MTITDKSDSKTKESPYCHLSLQTDRHQPKAQTKSSRHANGVITKIHNTLDMTASSNQAKCAKQSAHDNTVKALGRLEDYAKATK